MRRLLIGTLALVVLAGGAAGAWYYHDQTRTREKRGSSTIEFVTTAPAVKKRPEKLIEAVPWPMYGYDAARTHDAIQFKLRPPAQCHLAVDFGPWANTSTVVDPGCVPN